MCFSFRLMAKVFGVSRSGFYYWIKRRHKQTNRQQKQATIDDKVKNAFDEGKQRDGARRIQKERSEDGNHLNVKTIANSMKIKD
ncbi:hypothetical protein H8A87_16850 [Xenorhabdus sp. VLS]|uniref:Transposase n=1 Tax=Xenorhabdus lircayensis TaxID=2763499 RepID=A0ABS0U9Z2_9GAMM|nr:hypothetical protein [Xenorhabdus lircayensis]